MDEEAPEPQHLAAEGRGRRPWLLALVLVPPTLLVLVVIAWVVDTSRMGGQVVRNVELAGHDIGGLAQDDLPMVVDGFAEEFADRPVRVVTPRATYQTTAGDIGLAVDVERTADEALDVGRSETFPIRPFRWLVSFVDRRDAAFVFTVDSTTVRNRLIELEGDARTAPVEPTIAVEGDAFEVVPGRPGRGIDAGQVARLLPQAADDAGRGLIEVRVTPGPIEPRFSDADAQALADEATSLTTEPFTVRAGGRSGEVGVDVLRTWVTTVPGDRALLLRLDKQRVRIDLPGLVGPFPDAPRDARFVVEGGRPRLLAGRAGTVCCTDDSAPRILRALQEGTGSVELEVATRDPEFTTADAEKLGITQEIGSPDAFGPTTAHKCCEGRVTNIHRIADILRGVIIEPGETFSVNAYVGQRTRDRGFVPGGAIINGVVGEQIGGGVSQFATTFFNAALYAGLEFGEYQSHSLYIDRYPRGHEATISWPKPDLQIKNPTPYGVLVWPTYTATTITVHLYSTPYYTSITIGDPTPSDAGRCTRWTTPRARRTRDGNTLRDSVYARYRPGEGINC